MRSSTLLALSAATTLSTALPTTSHLPGTFAITDFNFGCGQTCSYSFNLSVQGSSANHPCVETPVKCSGTDAATDYIACGAVDETRTLSAYIVADTNELMLQYEVRELAQGATYWYYGQRVVYAATGPEAAKQKKDFTVVESSAAAIA